MFLHADSEDSDQTECTLILFVLSCRGSIMIDSEVTERAVLVEPSSLVDLVEQSP